MPSRMEAHVTLAEFIARAESKYNAEVRSLPGVLKGPKGQTQIAYLYRQVEGIAYFSPLQGIDETLALKDDVVRRLCGDLHIPLNEFEISDPDFDGYTFGTY